MDTAYVLSSQDETMATWQKTSDPIKIMDAAHVVFCEEDKNQIIEKILSFHPVDNFYVKKYPRLFKQINSDGYNNKIKVSLEPKIHISYSLVRNDPEWMIQFCNYIKDLGSFSYDFFDREQGYYCYEHFHNKKYKILFNKHDIYVRPTQKILEYNPKLAAKQLKIATNTSSAKSKVCISVNEVATLYYRLVRLFEHIVPIRISNYQIDRTKKNYCINIVLFINLIQKIAVPPTCYRQLKIFQEIKQEWKILPEKQRDQFGKRFCNLMDDEVKKRKPKNTNNNKLKPGFLNLYYEQNKLNASN